MRSSGQFIARKASRFIMMLVGVSLLGLSGCAVGSPSPTPLNLASQAAIAASRQSELAVHGYIEEEVPLRGMARRYKPDGDWRDDGRWAIKPHGAAQAFETRLLIRRPKNAARFNGIVVVEWLNTTMGFDVDGGWMLDRDEIMREGYAWVGVSAEAVSVQSLVAINPLRYAQVKLDSNELAFDVFTQAAQAVRQASAAWGRQDQSVKLLALGWSQSGVFLTTYINAFQPLSKAYDGYFLISTAPMAAHVDSAIFYSLAPQIRSDLSVPVMQTQTEMEVMVSWTLSKTPDTDKVRYWEIAGAVHFGRYLQDAFLDIESDEFKSIAPRCYKPTNTLPTHDIDQAALHALRMWVTTGTPPPKAPRMQRNGLGFVKSDEVGNGLGGLRLPELDAPLAKYGMYSNFPTNSLRKWAGYACLASGSTTPLDADVLHARYASSQAYFEAYKRAADKLLNAGFLRPADHAELLEQAKAVHLPQ